MELEALRYYLHTAQIEAKFGDKDIIGVPIDIDTEHDIKEIILYNLSFESNNWCRGISRVWFSYDL